MQQMARNAGQTMDQPVSKLCNVSEVPEGGVIQVSVGQEQYAVYKLDGEFFATEDMCSHGMVSLSQGDVEDGQIFCPLHGGAFDIRSGKATELPCRVPLKVYKVVRIGDELHADLSTPLQGQ